MTKLIDLTGQKFGKLTVIEYVGDSKWLCRCECGDYKIVRGKSLRNGSCKSCGCLIKEFNIKRNTTHNLSRTRLYRVYAHIKERCINKNCRDYKNYGGRGITICNEWLNDFMNFYDWAYDNGYNENAKKFECTIDRIDANGNYEPKNCRWVNQYIQNKNTRRNLIIEYKNEVHCLKDWCDILNLDYKKILQRIRKNKWSIEKAFTIP